MSVSLLYFALSSLRMHWTNIQFLFWIVIFFSFGQMNVSNGKHYTLYFIITWKHLAPGLLHLNLKSPDKRKGYCVYRIFKCWRNNCNFYLLKLRVILKTLIFLFSCLPAYSFNVIFSLPNHSWIEFLPFFGSSSWARTKVIMPNIIQSRMIFYRLLNDTKLHYLLCWKWHIENETLHFSW